MSEWAFVGVGRSFVVGLIMLVLVSLFGLVLFVMAMSKYPVQFKGVTLSTSEQVIVAVLLQLPLLVYVWAGYYTDMFL